MADREQCAELAHQLRGAFAVTREIARRMPPQTPLTAVAVLSALDRHGELRSSDLTELLAVDLSVTSRHVAHGVERGWIERAPDPYDGRSRLLRLTRPAATSCAPRRLARRKCSPTTSPTGPTTTSPNCRPCSPGCAAASATTHRVPPEYPALTRAEKDLRWRQPPTPASEKGTAATATTTDPTPPCRTGRSLEALSGLLLGLFVAILSSTSSPTRCPRSSPTLGGGAERSTPGWSPPRCSPPPRPPRSGASSPTCSARSC